MSVDGRTVAGLANSSDLSQAFRWTLAAGISGLGYLGVPPSPSIPFSIAEGLNANGTVIVGSSRTSSGSEEAFKWTAGVGMVGLGKLPGDGASSAVGVSANGSVVVGTSSLSTSAGPSQAVRWGERKRTCRAWFSAGRQPQFLQAPPTPMDQ